jgi:hypothetical protein
MMDSEQQKAEAKRFRLSWVKLVLLCLGCEVFHQTALAAGSVIFVDNTLRNCLVERADSGGSGGLRFFGGTGCNCFAGCGDECASGTTIDAIRYTFLFVLFVAFDC